MLFFSFFKENQPQVSRVSPEERDIACDACEAAVQVVSSPSYGQVLVYKLQVGGQVVSSPNYGQVLHKLQVGGQVQVQVPVLVTKCKCTWSVGQVLNMMNVNMCKWVASPKTSGREKEGCCTNVECSFVEIVELLF